MVCIVALFEKIDDHLEYLLPQLFGVDLHHHMHPTEPNPKEMGQIVTSKIQEQPSNSDS
jgi:hypothetical protein